VRKVLSALIIAFAAGCSSAPKTEVASTPVWVDEIGEMCHKMAERNAFYLVNKEKRTEDKDQQIIESDTRFMLGLIEHIKQQKIIMQTGNSQH
jgi:hypothetical protein